MQRPAAGVDLQQREVLGGVGGEHLGGQLGVARAELDRDLLGAVDDVLVGHDLAVCGDDEARAVAWPCACVALM